MKKVGEKVLFFDKEGVVQEIFPNASADIFKSNLYTIKFTDGTTKTIAESLLDDFNTPRSSTEKIDSYAKGINENTHCLNEIDKLCLEVNKKIQEIFEELHIDMTDNSIKTQKKNVFKLFSHVIQSSKYDYGIMMEKSNDASILDMEVKDIHRCLCQNRSICSSDAAALSLLFRRANIESSHLTIAEKGATPQGIHEVVKFVLDGETFICDPTLVRTSLEQGNIPEISPSVFAFTPNEFFELIYPSKEVKYEHEPIYL